MIKQNIKDVAKEILGGYRMKEYDATELAFKNGYEKGWGDAIRGMQEAIKKLRLTGNAYPVLVAKIIENVTKTISIERKEK